MHDEEICGLAHSVVVCKVMCRKKNGLGKVVGREKNEMAKVIVKMKNDVPN